MFWCHDVGVVAFQLPDDHEQVRFKTGMKLDVMAAVKWESCLQPLASLFERIQQPERLRMFLHRSLTELTFMQR